MKFITLLSSLFAASNILLTSAEIHHYSPGGIDVAMSESAGIYNPKVCFLESTWDSTGNSTSLRVSEEPAPYHDCLDTESQSQIIAKLFDLNYFDAEGEQLALEIGITQAMLLIHLGEEVLHTMRQSKTLTKSYLRYFAPGSFPLVHEVVQGLSRLLGKRLREGYHDMVRASPTSRLEVHNAQKSPEVDHHACDRGVVAYMSVDLDWYSDCSMMAVCPSVISSKTLADVQCSEIGDEVPTSLMAHGMAVTITHELFHWAVLRDYFPFPEGIVDGVLNSPNLGYPVKAYGAWATQELRRVQPQGAETSADSYVMFLLEEYLHQHCGVALNFVDSSIPRRLSNATHHAVLEDQRTFGNNDPTDWIALLPLLIPVILWRHLSWIKCLQEERIYGSTDFHPQSYLGFDATSQYIYLNGALVKRNSKNMHAYIFWLVELNRNDDCVGPLDQTAKENLAHLNQIRKR